MKIHFLLCRMGDLHFCSKNDIVHRINVSTIQKLMKKIKGIYRPTVHCTRTYHPTCRSSISSKYNIMKRFRYCHSLIRSFSIRIHIWNTCSSFFRWNVYSTCSYMNSTVYMNARMLTVYIYWNSWEYVYTLVHKFLKTSCFTYLILQAFYKYWSMCRKKAISSTVHYSWYILFTSVLKKASYLHILSSWNAA